MERNHTGFTLVVMPSKMQSSYFLWDSSFVYMCICIWIHFEFQINIYFKRQTMKFCICFRMVRGILLLSMFCSSQAVLKFNNYFGIYSFTSCEFSYRRNQRLSYKNMTRDSYTLYIHI